jgi:hypothetical protein
VLLAYSWISVYRDMDVISQKQMEWKKELVWIIYKYIL